MESKNKEDDDIGVKRKVNFHPIEQRYNKPDSSGSKSVYLQMCKYAL